MVIHDNIGAAWLAMLEEAFQGPQRREPQVGVRLGPNHTESLEVRELLDNILADKDLEPVDTVAGTLFPAPLYRDPGVAFSASMSPADLKRLDAAAGELYAEYGRMLPTLKTLPINRNGTYFSRAMSWPGTDKGGINQLAGRIARLRSLHMRQKPTRTDNVSNIDFADDAHDVAGVQITRADEARTLGFPCLAHIDLTLYRGVLSMTAIYRHQYMLRRAYGNLLGLTHLLQFLCQQSGWEQGNTFMIAGLANAEDDATKAEISKLIDDCREALAPSATLQEHVS